MRRQYKVVDDQQFHFYIQDGGRLKYWMLTPCCMWAISIPRMMDAKGKDLLWQWLQIGLQSTQTRTCCFVNRFLA
ncbi:hypothetical protein ACROYT_G030569 [Oculina patagonica]